MSNFPPKLCMYHCTVTKNWGILCLGSRFDSNDLPAVGSFDHLSELSNTFSRAFSDPFCPGVGTSARSTQSQSTYAQPTTLWLNTERGGE